MKTIETGRTHLLWLVCGMLFFMNSANAQKQVIEKYKHVVILGNSITRHGPKLQIGWYGDWGMAASVKDSDFVHLLMKKFHTVNPKITVHFKNIADYERGFWNYDLSQLNELRQLKPELIILRLGENIEPKSLKEHNFKSHYENLLNYLTANNPKARILHASSFWKKDLVAKEIQTVSGLRREQFLSLSDLSKDSTNMAFKLFRDRGVGSHPSDKGMKAIAQKIWEAVYEPVPKVSMILGAYYFDGWAGLTSHLTPELEHDFLERKPIGGWVTSKQHVMEEQMDLAVKSGLSFFSFCWYFTTIDEFKANPRNRALNFYLKAKNKGKLKYNLLVANHDNYIVGPQNWNYLCKYWIELFKNPLYLRVNGSPLLTFISTNSLVKSFGSTAKVNQALKELREMAKESGLTGVTVGACHYPEDKMIKLVAECGFDISTGYNYHESGYQKNQLSVPVDSLQTGSIRIWKALTKSPLPLIPAITANWDPRPWPIQYKNPKIYTGFSAKSVASAIKAAAKFMDDHPAEVTPERVALIYAWNEYGEGAWLTPSKILKDSLLKGVKSGLELN